MDKKDYYEVLGVSKGATKQEIKKSYRQLAKTKHPDRNKSANAEAEFKEIQEAYEVLSDEQKRQAYDQFGHAGAQGFGAGAGGYSGFGGGVNADDLSDIFSSFFGDSFGGFGFSGQQQRPGTGTRGADIEATLKVDFDEAIFGKYKTINYKRKVVCTKCTGSGAESATDVVTCKTCNGSGRVTRTQSTFLGTIQTATVCPDCQGRGKTVSKKCSICLGEGRESKDEELKIKIPPGIPDGVTIRFRDSGNAGMHGGSYGDLYITIDVEDHPVLERRGDDVYMETDIDVTAAVLGEEIEVPSVRGKINLKIPAGTQAGKLFRLSGKGGPKFKGSGNGDQYVKVNVKIPKKLSRKQTEYWQKLAEIKDEKPGIFG